jgi:hypothetical protein
MPARLPFHSLSSGKRLNRSGANFEAARQKEQLESETRSRFPVDEVISVKPVRAMMEPSGRRVGESVRICNAEGLGAELKPKPLGQVKVAKHAGISFRGRTANRKPRTSRDRCGYESRMRRKESGSMLIP